MELVSHYAVPMWGVTTFWEVKAMKRFNFLLILVLSFAITLPAAVLAQESETTTAVISSNDEPPTTDAAAERKTRINLGGDEESDYADDYEAAEADDLEHGNTRHDGQGGNDDVNAESSSSPSEDSENKRKLLHNLQLSMSFVDVPSFIIGAWFSKHGNMWDGRANLGVGLDYFLRFVDLLELRIGLNWSDLQTKPAYWLTNKNKDEYQLADYIKQDLSVLALEVAVYGYVDIIPEISFYYGGGLWGGVLLGEANAYNIRTSCADEIKQNGGNLQSCPHEPGSAPILGLPPVIGFVMATIGFKFTVWETLTLRAEGGFKGYFYGQIGIGAQF